MMLKSDEKILKRPLVFRHLINYTTLPRKHCQFIAINSLSQKLFNRGSIRKTVCEFSSLQKYSINN